jgi:hypothetical protein
MNNNQSKELDLTKLLDGIPLLDEAYVQLFTKCCTVCLEHHHHQRNVQLKVSLKFEEVATVYYLLKNWLALDAKMRRSYRNLKDTVEYAACGIAGLLITELTGYEIIEQSQVGEGIDFWLSKKIFEGEPTFMREARLEVSGILNGTEKEINTRVKLKMEQTKQSDTTNLPAYIIVVEFSNLQAQVVKR